MKKIFFGAVFISLTFPRAGFYWYRIPVTLANLLLLGILSIWIIRWIAANKRLPEGPIGRVSLIYISYAAGCAAVGLAQNRLFETVSGFMATAGYLGLYFLTGDILKTREDVRSLYKIIMVSLAMVLGYGLWQVFFDIKAISIPGLTELYRFPFQAGIGQANNINQYGGDALSKNLIWGLGQNVLVRCGNKIFSTFHHGNLLGNHLAMFIPIIVTSILRKTDRDKIILMLLGLLAFIILLFTNSRAALFSSLVGIVVLIFIYKGYRRRIFFLSAIMIIGAITIFSLIVSLSVFQGSKIGSVDPNLYLCYGFGVRYLGLAERAFSLNCFSTVGEIDGLTNYRIESLRIALRTIFKERSPGQILFGNAFNISSETVGHDYYLGMILEIGVIGVILFGILLYYLFSRFISALPELSEVGDKAIALGGLAGLIGSLFHNLFDFIFYFPPTLANFWILAGFIMGLMKVCKEKNGGIVKKALTIFQGSRL